MSGAQCIQCGLGGDEDAGGQAISQRTANLHSSADEFKVQPAATKHAADGRVHMQRNLWVQGAPVRECHLR